MDALLVGKLIEACTRLEHALEHAGASGSGLKELMVSLPLDPGTEKELKFIRRVRNACAHDGGVADEEIREALQRSTALLERGLIPPKKKAEKPENLPRVKHFLLLEITLVVIIYAAGFCISLTPRALNIATITAFYLVLSWEIVYAVRSGRSRALGVEALCWCLMPLMMGCGAPDRMSTRIVIAFSGVLPLVQLGIAVKSAIYPVLVLLFSAIAGVAARCYFGNWGIAAGAAAAMFLSFAGMAMAAKSR